MRVPRSRFGFLAALFLSFSFPACLHRRAAPLPPESSAVPSAAFGSPLKNATRLSSFGKRGGRYHTGIDLRARRSGGDPVLASRAGVVTRTQQLRGYGNLVEIEHADGFCTRYAHLRSIKVEEGQRVAEGEEIGVVGATGRATTPHLHFEILTPLYRFVDPALFLR